jgi:hypothetical protein
MGITQPLVRKYRPQQIQDFIGLDNVKRVLLSFAAKPYPSNWLFRGPSGIGKTSMALALARALGLDADDVITRNASTCDVEFAKRILRDVEYVRPSWKPGRWDFYLIDEADQMTEAAYQVFLTILDPPGPIWPYGIFVFTANSPEKIETVDDDDVKHEVIHDKLEPKFRSRCRQLEFQSQGMGVKIPSLLSRLWSLEAPPGATPPNFKQLATYAHGNVRDAVQDLETRILDCEYGVQTASRTA